MVDDRNIVRAFERGLNVLTALNQFNGLSILQIQAQTGYSRAGLYRILETLTHEGYVAISPADKLYRLTSKTRSLSNGYQSDRWLPEMAERLFQENVLKIPWPVVLSIWRDEKLVVECMSANPSKISVRRLSSGWELHLFQSAAGIITLGLMHDQKLSALIADFAATQHDPALKEAELRKNVEVARSQGYAIYQNGNNRSIAVSVNYAPIAIGALGIFGEDSTKWSAKKNIDIVNMLRSLAKKIGQQLS